MTTGVHSTDEEDETDAEALYCLLEEEIIPLYYDPDHKGVPHRWVHLCFHSRALLALPPDVGSAKVIVWDRGL